mgnify:CR=1 FL=1
MQTTHLVAAAECEVEIKTAGEYFIFCREVCYTVLICEFKLIGCPVHTVELDETHLYTRKYNRGHLLHNEKKSVWIFGGIDRDMRDCFIIKFISFVMENLLKANTSYQKLKAPGQKFKKLLNFPVPVSCHIVL